VNNRWKVTVTLVLLVLVSAIGLSNLAAKSAPSDVPTIVAHGGGPVPPPPWKHGGGPVPPPPWQHGGGPVPPPPWKN
jgi:hypothetical protein